MAYKHASNYCDGGNWDWFGSYIDWHSRQIDCDQLRLCINEYIVESIVISSDCISMGIDGGFNGGFDGGLVSGFGGGSGGGFCGGSFNQFHLAMLGYQPQQSIRQLRWEAFTAISREDLTGSSLNKLVILKARFTDYSNSDLTLL
jgi:hypothetical protein